MLVKRLIDGEFMIVPYSSLIIFFSSAQLSSSRDFRVVVELNKQRILTIIIRLYTILSQWAKSVKKSQSTVLRAKKDILNIFNDEKLKKLKNG